MIFKQYDLVLSGVKTQTRRLCNPGDFALISIYQLQIPNREFPDAEFVFNSSDRTRFRVGMRLPIIPKRGAAAIRDEGGSIRRVEIINIRREYLQSISPEDAIREGVGSRTEYHALWDSINTRPGIRWSDNPQVWVITFKLVGIIGVGGGQ